MEKFSKHDWDHMHDCILHCTWNTTKKKSTREELVELFDKLPDDLKEDAYEFGMSDTLWRDNFIEFFMKKIF